MYYPTHVDRKAYIGQNHISGCSLIKQIDNNPQKVKLWLKVQKAGGLLIIFKKLLLFNRNAISHMIKKLKNFKIQNNGLWNTVSVYYK